MTFPSVGVHTGAQWETWDGQNHAVEGGSVTIASDDQGQFGEPEWLIHAPPLSFDVVDLDVDSCGDAWLLTAEGDLYRYDRLRSDLRRIHCTWDEPPRNPRAIAVTADTVYVGIGAPESGGETTDTDDAGRIHAFSRHSFQTRWVADERYEDPIAFARHGKTVSVLDGGDGAFIAEIGSGGAPVSQVTGFRSPVDLDVDGSGDRYILDGNADRTAPSVERVPAEGTSVEIAIPTEAFVSAETGAMPRAIALTVGFPDEVIVGTDGTAPTEPSLFRYDPTAGEFERLTAFTGAVTGLLLRRGDAVDDPGLYVVSQEGAAVSFLQASERYRVNPGTGRYDAGVATRLDSGEDGTQWHRLTTSHVATEAGTQLRVHYYATDDEDPRPREPWIGAAISLTRLEGIGTNIASRLRAAGIRDLGDLVGLSARQLAAAAGTDDYPVSRDRAADWIDEAEAVIERYRTPGVFEWRSVGPPNPEDALLSDAYGRYLWVKVSLIGTPETAARIDSLRAYFPRQSYLRYLPAVYQEDAGSAAFLERYLSLFESVFTDVEEEIEAATRYLDPDGVPGDALSWLAGWLALSTDETWSISGKRELVRRAHELFKQRGTRAGLRELLGIYLKDRATRPPAWQWALDRQREDVAEREASGELTAEEADRLRERLDRDLFVWERTDLDCIDDPDVRAIFEQLLPCPQCFAVLVWPSLFDEELREVQRLVDSTRPAHAVGRAIRLQSSFRLAGHERDGSHHSFLGVNTVLGDREFVVESSGLGTDTRLTEREPSGQFGVTERLGIDTDLS